MIKLLYCIPSLDRPGGTERILTSKVNYLVKTDKYKVYIVLTETQKKEPFYKLDPKVEIINTHIDFEEDYKCNILKRIIIYRQKIRKYKDALTNILYEIKPDFTTSLLSHEIDFLCSLADGSKKIGECHFHRNFRIDFVKSKTDNPILIWLSRLRNWDLGRKTKGLDLLVCLTKDDCKKWKDISKKTVIPNFINFSSDEKSDNMSKKIICAGRYTRQKGFDMLLEVWRNIEDKYPEWGLYIYGDGEERSNLESFVESNKLNNVHLEHMVNDIKEKMLEGAFFVMPSRFEGFGMVITEAMECGLPVIAFDCNYGPSEIISNNSDGILVPQNNLTILQESIEYLINSEDKRIEMGKHAIIKAKSYSVDNIMKTWMKIYS